VQLYHQLHRIHQQIHRFPILVKILWKDYLQNKSIHFLKDHQTIDDKNGSINNKFQQPAFLHSFEAELDKVDEYFQTKAPDVRQSILDSLQRMYNQNEWHDNPLTIICRDLDIHVRNDFLFAKKLMMNIVLFQ
jgi:hypothetical protein